MRLVLTPLIIPAAGSVWLTIVFWRDWRSHPIANPGAFPEWAAVVLLAAAAAWCLFLMWRTTAPSRLEPQTDITRACDFSENVGGLLERERHIYKMSNKAFADAMATANSDRLWTPHDQSRSNTRGLVLGVLTLALLPVLIVLLKLFGF